MSFATAERRNDIYDLKRDASGVYVYVDARPRHPPRATKALIAMLVAVFALQSLVPGLTSALAVISERRAARLGGARVTVAKERGAGAGARQR
jgi:hypothetical protein